LVVFLPCSVELTLVWWSSYIFFLVAKVQGTRGNAYITNGWDKRKVDPNPNKLYTHKKAAAEEKGELPEEGCFGDWPKGSYT